MKSLRKVVWTEGMLMRPQHLQQADYYHEQLLLQMHQNLTPYFWGVSGIEFDSAALQAGKIRLRSFAGVMPNGLLLNFSDGAPETPPERSIHEYMGTDQSIDIHLAVPHEKEGNANYSGIASNTEETEFSRFRVDRHSVIDLTNKDSATTLDFAHPVLSLRFSGEPTEDYETLKIAEIKRESNGNLAFEPSYIPPCLKVGASLWLCQRLIDLQSNVLAKQNDLAQSRKQIDAKSVEFGPSDIGRGLQLLGLNQAIPLIQYLIDNTHTSPLQAYLWLAQVVGMLCTFNPEGNPSAIQKFDFLDLRATFRGLINHISNSLGVVARMRYMNIALSTKGDRLYWGSLDDERLDKFTKFILAVRSSMPENQVSENTPKMFQIAAWSEINELFNSATPGLPLYFTHRPPSEIPIRPGVVYFQLSDNHQYWQSIMNERNIAIYTPPPFDANNTQIELFAIPGGPAESPPKQVFSSSRISSSSKFSRSS
jgi:type VI secretion system protein ImpJ